MIMFCVVFISIVLLAKRLRGENKENAKLSWASFLHYLVGSQSLGGVNIFFEKDYILLTLWVLMKSSRDIFIILNAQKFDYFEFFVNFID